MSKVVNWGVLGAANFARQHMAPAIHGADGARFAALATSSADKAALFQSFAPDIEVFTAYDAMLASDSIDAVYIPLPNHLHVEWALKAIKAGKHVLCEKPIAMKADQIDALIKARDESGLAVQEAYMILHHPQWQRAQEIVDSGEIGALRHVQGTFTFDNRADTGNIRNRPETGGGALPDIGVYTYGSTRFITGAEPTEITSAHLEYDGGIDSYAHVTGKFGGVTFSLLNSMRMANRQRMEFHGEKGVLALTAPFNANVFGEARLTVETTGGVVREERFAGVQQYKLQVENFSALVRGDRVDYPGSLEFAKGTQAMIDMVYAAAK
jgi:predicted dehydrogenase